MPSRHRRAVAEPLERRQLLTVVSGFTESLFVSGGIDTPTAMAFAPDGRLFVAEMGGGIRVVQANGQLNPTPFATLPTIADGERGVIGIAIDPQFNQNAFVYAYYTVSASNGNAPFNRIVRFVADGDVAQSNTPQNLFDLDPLSGATNHNGGAMHFGADGKLYVAVGDNANGTFAQSLETTHGKMLRLNSNGSIPNDNPFFDQASGDNRAIWAMGLRNPFTFDIQPGTGRIFINDVGQSESEEINEGVPGANYGWPGIEGPRVNETPPPDYEDPIFSYGHDVGIAITGGAFYNPPGGASGAFPAAYTGDYFYADLGGSFVRRFDPASGQDVSFATGISRPVDLDVDTAGNLYVLSNQGNGRITRFSSNAVAPQPPGITQQPQSRTVEPGESATFSVTANGSGTLRYQWQRNGANIAGASSPTLTINSAAAGDNGAQFRVIVSNDGGDITSAAATLTVSTNQAPSAAIVAPTAGTTFAAGDTINFIGDASDPEDGALPDSAFSWKVEYITGSVVRPFVADTPGVRGSSFTIPTQTPYTESDVLFRITLTVTDSDGAATVVTRDVTPRTSTFTLRSEPAGIALTLDGQPAPAGNVTGVVGLSRLLGAPAPATLDGVTYVFDSWSDGGAATHTVNTAEQEGVAYVATYRPLTVGNGAGLAATYFDNRDFTGRSISRIDPALDFDLAAGESPDPAIAPTKWSARYSAQLEPAVSETFTFLLTADDGARLTVNGQVLVDRLNARSVSAAATIDLVAGQRYDLLVEYVQRKGPASLRLEWSSASTPQQIVPTANLFPPPGSATTLIRFPAADATTQDGRRAPRAFGGSKSLLVSSGERAGSNREAFLTFDLTDLPDLASATLVLTGKARRVDAQVGLFAVDDPSWQEATVTHDTRPASSASPLATFAVTRGAKQAYEIDLTNFLLEQKTLGRASVSVALKSLEAGPVATFAAREAKAGGPELRVTS